MKFFPIALLLPLAFNGLKGSTLPQERPADCFDTAILSNLSGLYEAKTSCDNVDTTSFSASHEYQFNSGEENSCDFGHKFACIITNFLQSVTNLVGCDKEENGTLTVRLNTGVSQTEDGGNCPKVQKCVLPTLTIKATDCRAPGCSICGKCDQSKKDGQGNSNKEQNVARGKQECCKNRKTSSEEEPFQSLTKIGESGGFGFTDAKSGPKLEKPTLSFIKPTEQSFPSQSEQYTVSPSDILPPVLVSRQPAQGPNSIPNENFPFQNGINPVPQVVEPFEPSAFVERQRELNQFGGERPTAPLFEKEQPQIIQPEVQIPLENSFENKQAFSGSSNQQTEISPTGISSEVSSTAYAHAETNIKSEVQKEPTNSNFNQGNQCPRQLQRPTAGPDDVCSQQQTSTVALSESAYQVNENVASNDPMINDSPNQKFNENISNQREGAESQVPQPQPSSDNSFCSDQSSTNEGKLTTCPRGPQTSNTFEGSEQDFRPPVNQPPSPSPSPKTQTFTPETLGIAEGVNDYPTQVQNQPEPIAPLNSPLEFKPTFSPPVQAYPESFDSRNPKLNGQSEGQLTGPFIPPNNQRQNFSPGFGSTIPQQSQTSFEGKETPADRTESASASASSALQGPPMDYSPEFQNSRIPPFLKPNNFYPGRQPIYYPPERYPPQGHFENYPYNNYPRFNPQGPRPSFNQPPFFPGEDIKPPYPEQNRFGPPRPFPNDFHPGNPGLENSQRYPYREQFFNNGNRYPLNERPNFQNNPMTPGMVPEYPPPSQPYQNNFRPFRNEPEYLMRERGVQSRPYELQNAKLGNKAPILTPPYGPNYESVPFYPRNYNIDRFGNNPPFRPESRDFHPVQVPDKQRIPPFGNPQGQNPNSSFGQFLIDKDQQVENQNQPSSPFNPPSYPNKELNRPEIPNTVRNQEVFEASNDYKKAQFGLNPNEMLAGKRGFEEEGVTQTSNLNEQLQNSRNQNLPEPNFELNRQAPGQMPNEEFQRLRVQQMQAQQQENSAFGRPEQLNIPFPDSSGAQFRGPFPQQPPSAMPDSSNQGGAPLNFQAQNPNFINPQNPNSGLNPLQNNPPGLPVKF